MGTSLSHHRACYLHYHRLQYEKKDLKIILIQGGKAMSGQVDARGLSCPQPVVITCKKMEKIGTGTIEVLVDAATSRDNIKRMAINQGWQVEIQEKEDEFLLILTKS